MRAAVSCWSACLSVVLAEDLAALRRRQRARNPRTYRARTPVTRGGWLASAESRTAMSWGGIHRPSGAEQAGGIRSFGLARVPLTLYWVGRRVKPPDRAAQAVERAGCPTTSVPPLRSSTWAQPLRCRPIRRCASRLRRARAFRRLRRSLLARATSMSVAPLLSLGDLKGAATRAARGGELAPRALPPRERGHRFS